MKKIKLEGIYKLRSAVVRFAITLTTDDDFNIVSIKIKAPNQIYDRYFIDDCLFNPSGQRSQYDIYPIVSRPGEKEIMNKLTIHTMQYAKETGAILTVHGDWCYFYQVITISIKSSSK